MYGTKASFGVAGPASSTTPAARMITGIGESSSQAGTSSLGSEWPRGPGLAERPRPIQLGGRLPVADVAAGHDLVLEVGRVTEMSERESNPPILRGEGLDQLRSAFGIVRRDEHTPVRPPRRWSTRGTGRTCIRGNEGNQRRPDATRTRPACRLPVDRARRPRSVHRLRTAGRWQWPGRGGRPATGTPRASAEDRVATGPRPTPTSGHTGRPVRPAPSGQRQAPARPAPKRAS